MGWQMPLDLPSVSFSGISQCLTITVTQQRSTGLPESFLKKLQLGEHIALPTLPGVLPSSVTRPLCHRGGCQPWSPSLSGLGFGVKITSFLHCEFLSQFRAAVAA